MRLKDIIRALRLRQSLVPPRCALRADPGKITSQGTYALGGEGLCCELLLKKPLLKKPGIHST